MEYFFEGMIFRIRYVRLRRVGFKRLGKNVLSRWKSIRKDFLFYRKGNWGLRRRYDLFKVI